MAKRWTLDFLMFQFFLFFSWSAWPQNLNYEDICRKTSKNPDFIFVIRQLKADFQEAFGSLKICHCRQFPRKVRAKFEDELERDLVQRFPVGENSALNPIVLASYGSGRLLQEFIIVSKLVSRGYNFLKIIPIDPIYEDEKEWEGVKALGQFSKYLQNLAQQKQGEMEVRPFKSAQDYISKTQEDELLKAHVLLDVDSDSFRDKSDFYSLDSRVIRPEGVVYRLINDHEGTKGYISQGTSVPILMKGFEAPSCLCPGPS